ncbi:TonB-dependent siderophore receptor [Halioxenophilus aromaticivorans]|uniref:Ferric-rhodotorulic acid/ferric-coprogen receptor FhuE n=1 Tax=Halioxenophilus aromaticivorans TaxID=1306992 RepID=A0AAV3U863_9ALTE
MQFRPFPIHSLWHAIACANSQRAACAVVVGCMGSTLALAQNAGLEEVVVEGKYLVNEQLDTATGLGLSRQETPQSVTILTAQRIIDQNLATVVDTVLNTVGVNSTEVDNVRNTLQARGFDIANYQIDGVPLAWSLAGDSGETIADVSIYERVEFVRGSTGLLTGQGDPSASINLVRKHATSQEFKGYAAGAVGSWDTREVSFDVANKLSPSGAIRGRLVGKYKERESYSDYFSAETNVLYGTVEADLSSSTLLRAGFSYQSDSPDAAVWGGLPGIFSDGSATDWDVETTTAPHWSAWDTTSENAFVNLQHTFVNDWELTLSYNKLSYENDTRLLYLYGDLDAATGAGLISWPYRSEGESDQDSFNFQLQGEYSLFGAEHEFVVGGLYSEQSAVAKTYTALTNSFLAVDNFYQWNGDFLQPQWSDSPTTTAQDMDTEQEGLFAATRINVSDALKVILGGRISSWQRSGQSYATVTDFGEDDVLVPYFGVLYDINDEHRVYASYTSIFNPQNAQDLNGNYLDSIEGNTFEVGLKSQFLNDRLQASLAVFRIEQDNLGQDHAIDGVVQYVPGSPGSIAQIESEGVTSEGFEIELVGQLLDGWNATVGYSYFTAEDAAGVDVNTDHPRKQFNLFTTYQLVDALPQLTLGGGINWQDETYQGGASQDAYTLIDLMARYDITENLNLQLNLKNLTDEKYYNYIAGNSQVRFGAPRNGTLSVRYLF